jgi:hypothetical protein
VFCSIDGAKKLRWRRAEARQEVHQLCSRCIRETLRSMPEGYLSGEQPGDLKYMVAFASPEVSEDKGARLWALRILSHHLLAMASCAEAGCTDPSHRSSSSWPRPGRCVDI